MNIESFESMKPAQKKEVLARIYQDATDILLQPQPRTGQTQGFAFLWINIYGKDKLSQAFKRFLNNHPSVKVVKNYRGAKFAWFFGSQSDLGKYDSYKAMAASLSANGIDAYLDDAWD